MFAYENFFEEFEICLPHLHLIPQCLVCHRRKLNYFSCSCYQMNMCRLLLTTVLSSGSLQRETSVCASSGFPNIEARISGLPFSSSSFSVFLWDRHHVCSFPIFSRKFLYPPRFLKELPAALGLLQTTSRSWNRNLYLTLLEGLCLSWSRLCHHCSICSWFLLSSDNFPLPMD